MSYDTYLHRTFDAQLCPDSSTIIDWAPVVRRLRPLFQSSSHTWGDVYSTHTTHPWRTSVSHAPLHEEVHSTPGTRNSSPPPPLVREGSTVHEVIHPFSTGRLALTDPVEAGGGGSGLPSGTLICEGNFQTGKPTRPTDAPGPDGESTPPPPQQDVYTHGNTAHLSSSHIPWGASRAWTWRCLPAYLLSAAGMDRGSHPAAGAPQPWRSAAHTVCSSYGCAPLYVQESFSLSGGLFTALGVSSCSQGTYETGSLNGTEGKGSSRKEVARDAAHPCNNGSRHHAKDAHVDVGVVDRTLAVRAVTTAQLTAYWGARRWQGVVNLRLLPMAEKTRMPVCECVLRTPWTESALQIDELLILWSGLLTLYQREVEGPEPPPTVASLASKEDVTQAVRTLVAAKKAERERRPPSASPSAEPRQPSPLSDAAHARAPAGNKPKGVAATGTPLSNPPEPVRTPTANAGTPLAPPLRPWYQLRQLKVGLGLAIKNDAAGGKNVYAGCSGRLGNGLSFCCHIDALRRAYWAVSSTLGPMELSTRLRVNWITYHGTVLDAGIGWRPLPQSMPRTKLQAAVTGRGVRCGLQLEDATHELFAGWMARHAAGRVAREEAASGRPTAPPPTVRRVKQPPHATEHPPCAEEEHGGWISLGWASAAWHAVAGGQQTTAPAAPIPAAPPEGTLSWASTRAVGRAAGALREGATEAARAVSRTVGQGWRTVTQADWLERMLDEVHVDVSVGVMQTQGSSNSWRSFLVLSAH